MTANPFQYDGLLVYNSSDELWADSSLAAFRKRKGINAVRDGKARGLENGEQINGAITLTRAVLNTGTAREHLPVAAKILAAPKFLRRLDKALLG